MKNNVSHSYMLFAVYSLFVSYRSVIGLHVIGLSVIAMLFVGCGGALQVEKPGSNLAWCEI